ncbi:MAG: hypothetical protein J6X69_07190 [Bacteroidales bacterium]|nr:hypothetical protein [Bacteroidales bacterium]
MRRLLLHILLLSAVIVAFSQCKGKDDLTPTEHETIVPPAPEPQPQSEPEPTTLDTGVQAEKTTSSEVPDNPEPEPKPDPQPEPEPEEMNLKKEIEAEKANIDEIEEEPEPEPEPEPQPEPEPEPQPEPQVSGITLNLVSSGSNQITFSQKNGEYIIQTTGSDPFAYTAALSNSLDNGFAVVSFDYTSSAAVNELQLFYCDPVTAERARSFGTMSAASSWTNFTCLIALDRLKLAWGRAGNRLRFDFGSNAGVTIRIKNLLIREMNPSEQALYNALAGIGGGKEDQAQRITNYLNASWPCSITSVNVGASNVTISGRTDGKGNYYLADIAPYENPMEMMSFARMTAISGTSFTLTLPRRYARQGYTYDSVLSRWIIVRKEGGLVGVSSHARYADQVQAIHSPAQAKLKSKKGLGGLDEPRLSDIQEMNIGTVTLNIVMDWMISTQQDGNFPDPYVYEGRTYYINRYIRNQLDKCLKFCYDRNVVVCAIVLFNVSNVISPATAIMKHPEYICTRAGEGLYTMPNMTTAQASHLYAAVINYLGERYSSATYGRIHHWILHNEVDYAREWTNMGAQPEMRYMDTYIRSMRLCYNIIRQYDQHSSAMISLTHCWNKADGQYRGKSLLDDLLKFSAREGDFLWGVGYHSYPQALEKPQFLIDDTQSTYNANSNYCTFKNLEVIDNWARNTSHFYKGTTKRVIFLSENGTNSPSYAQSDLTLQAAGACWAWKKVKALSGIDGIHWHNWRDDSGEGLLIGLRSFPSNNSAPKQAWQVWKYADTSQEDAVFAPYLSTIGISNWASIMHPF